MTVHLKFYKHGIHEGAQGAWFRQSEWGERQKSAKFFSYESIKRFMGANFQAATTPGQKWYAPDEKGGLLQSDKDWHITSKDFMQALDGHQDRLIIKLDQVDKACEAHRRKSMAFCYAYVAMDGEPVARFSNGRKSLNLTRIDIETLGERQVGTLANMFNPEAGQKDGLIYPLGELVRASKKLSQFEIPSPA